MAQTSRRTWNPLRWIARKRNRHHHTMVEQHLIGEASDVFSIKGKSRYKACLILYEAGVPCLIWGEDALTAYGIPTIVFDLFLLVHDPELAAKQLATRGFRRTAPNARFSDIHQMSHKVPRLAEIPGSSENESTGEAELPDADDVNAPGVILLPAKDWNYDLPHTTADIDNFLPPLGAFLDTLLKVWIDIPEFDAPLREHVATHIGYVYLYNEDVRKPEFEKHLHIEIRHIHFHLLADNHSIHVELTTKRCQQHHRAIRDQIRQMTYEPKDASHE